MNYIMRVYCEDEHDFKYSEPLPLEETHEDWVPVGCEEHTIRDYCLLPAPVEVI